MFGELLVVGFNWDVQFKVGWNELIVLVYQEEYMIVIDILEIIYEYQQVDKVDYIVLNSFILFNGNIFIEVVMKDKNNWWVLDYEEEVYFFCDGVGILFKYYGIFICSQVI